MIVFRYRWTDSNFRKVHSLLALRLAMFVSDIINSNHQMTAASQSEMDLTRLFIISADHCAIDRQASVNLSTEVLSTRRNPDTNVSRWLTGADNKLLVTCLNDLSHRDRHGLSAHGNTHFRSFLVSHKDVFTFVLYASFSQVYSLR